eukprot:8542243-Pyramimonas_sp.AAC.1
MHYAREVKAQNAAARQKRMGLEELVAFDTCLKSRLKRWAFASVVKRFSLANKRSRFRLVIRRRDKKGKGPVSRLFTMDAVLEVGYDHGSRPD